MAHSPVGSNARVFALRRPLHRRCGTRDTASQSGTEGWVSRPDAMAREHRHGC